MVGLEGEFPKPILENIKEIHQALEYANFRDSVENEPFDDALETLMKPKA